MTRLEKQIKELQDELNAVTNFSNEKKALFAKVESKFAAVLKSYGINEYDAESNTFVDKSVMEPKHLIYRMYIQADCSDLTDRKKNNMEAKLRQLVPMSFSPISRNHISVVYSEPQK